MDDYLKDRLKSGKVMLFLGAGSSYGALNKFGQMPPDGYNIAALMADKCKISFDAENDSLTTISGVTRKRLGDHEYYKFLESHYKKCNPSNDQKKLCKYHFPRIYTTNIDDSLEIAYIRSGKHITVINKDAPIRDLDVDAGDTQLIKINGSVNQLDSGIIFSTDEYTKEASRVGSWYEQLARDFSNYTFVFVGSRLNEPLFYHHVNRLVDATGRRPGKSYIVCPSFTEIQKEDFNYHNIDCFESTISKFSEFVSSTLGDYYDYADALRHAEPAYVEAFRRVKPDLMVEVVREAHAIIPITHDHLSNSYSEHFGGLRNYYFGAAPTWRDIIDNVPAQLSDFEAFKKSYDLGNPLTMITGYAGSGKSTCLMQLAFELSKSRGNHVFFINSNEIFPSKALQIISQHIEDVVFFIDDFEWCHEKVLEALTDGSMKGVRFVAAERTAPWSRIADAFNEVKHSNTQLSRISKYDSSLVLDKLEKHGPWNRLKKLNHKERIEEIYIKSARQLLVGLKEATQGVGFEAIIKNEYNQINDEKKLLAVHISALAHMNRFSISHSTFDTVTKAAFGDILLPRDMGLEGIIIDDGYSVRLRHSIIADYLVRQVIPHQELMKSLRVLFYALARFKSPLRVHAKNIEYQLYSSISNYKFLTSILDRNSCLALFKEFEKDYEEDGLYWLQYARFEYSLGPDYHETALNHIRIALQTFPSSFQIIHAFAQMHFGLAEAAENKEQAMALLGTATALLEEQIRDRPLDNYPLVALSMGKIKVYKKWMPESLLAEGRAVVDKLKEAEKKTPGDPKLGEAIWEIGVLASTPDFSR